MQTDDIRENMEEAIEDYTLGEDSDTNSAVENVQDTVSSYTCPISLSTSRPLFFPLFPQRICTCIIMYTRLMYYGQVGERFCGCECGGMQ